MVLHGKYGRANLSELRDFEVKFFGGRFFFLFREASLYTVRRERNNYVVISSSYEGGQSVLRDTVNSSENKSNIFID